ncbi:gag-pol polyprotein [Tanacetum coccineum]
MSKKQNCTAMSSAEAEYVALSASCAQVMWMRTQLQDYGFNYNKIPLTEYQLADMFTKALLEDRFKYLVRRIGMRCLTPADLEVVRLGINPMIQPEPEDLPKDNPRLNSILSEYGILQDVKTNLFWEFGKFTSRDGESMESYYARTNYNLPVTRQRGRQPITPQSESVSEEDSDPEQAQRDKEMQKNLALLAKYFKKLYKPTNNNLRTSSNSRNKTEDTTPRYNNDNQSRQFGNQRTMTVAGARETVGSQVVQQTGIQCFNCKGYGHYAKECRKPKRVKDYAYHKEKMMMCKQAEQGVPLQAEQADWLEDTDEEIDEQELEAHYSYMAKIQEVSPEESSSTGQPLEQVQNHDESNVYDNVRRHYEQPESINDTYVLKKDDSNVTPDSSNICTNDNQVDQNAAECVDERAALANLIANLTLDTEENKTILKQERQAIASWTQELENAKLNLDEN